MSTSVSDETADNTDNITVPVESHLTAPTGTGVVPPDENDATGSTGSNNTGSNPDIPDTGERAGLMLIVTVTFLSMAGLVLAIAKKKRNS